jgi:radical SAM superfamily enzyme YgiQ (UPF0313 family)
MSVASIPDIDLRGESKIELQFGTARPLVVLVNPCSVRRFAVFCAPIGVIHCAVHLYQRYRVEIIDQVVEPNWESRFRALLAQRPVCVGISAMSGRQVSEGLRFSEIAKEYGAITIWGGPHPSLSPEQTVSHPLVDYAVQGEGEETLRDFVDSLVEGRPVENIRGLWSKRNGEIYYAGDRKNIDLDALPDIPYHLVDLRNYIKETPFGPAISLYTSRGCPQRCAFCYIESMHKSKYRTYSAARVMHDIKRIRAAYPEIRQFQFWDDNFFAGMRRAREIAERFMEEMPDLTWSVLGAHVQNVSRMDDEYMAVLQRSGLKSLVMGVESGSQRILDDILKNFKVEQLLESNRKMRRYGIQPTYTFMSGIPGETDEDVKETIKLMFKLAEDNPDAILGNIKPYVPFPGTRLYERAQSMGFRPPARLEDWSRFVWTNYVSLGIPWMNLKRRRRLNHLYFYTVLMNPDYLFLDSKVFTLASKLLKPIATWRVRNMRLELPLAGHAMRIAEQIFM